MRVDDSSKLYRPISRVELQKLRDIHFPHVQITKAAPMAGGLFNTTYHLFFSDCSEAVLRLEPVNQQLLLPFERNTIRSSVLAAEMMRLHGVPTARVLASDTAGENIGRAYLVSEYVPGITMMEAKDEAGEGCMYEVGQYMQKMHRIRGERFGRLADLAVGGGFASWSRAVQAEAEACLRSAAPYQLFDSETTARLTELFEEGTTVLDDVREPHMAHGDLWPANILVKRDSQDGRYHVAAIIDADRAIFGDTDFDFPSGKLTNRAFLRGYGKQLPEDLRARHRHRLYALLYSMLAYYSLRIEHEDARQAQRHYDYIQNALKRQDEVES